MKEDAAEALFLVSPSDSRSLLFFSSLLSSQAQSAMMDCSPSMKNSIAPRCSHATTGPVSTAVLMAQQDPGQPGSGLPSVTQWGDVQTIYRRFEACLAPLIRCDDASAR